MSDTHAEEARRLCEEGYALLEAGNIGAAEAALVRARALDPHNPLVHFRLALVFVDSGRAVDAVAALDASLRLQPDNARAHNNRGSALQLVGRHGDAEHAFRRALALDPDLAQPYANLGHLLEKQGQARDAADLYRQALARDVDRAFFEHQLAALLGARTDRAPEEWVRATFDNFAPVFDSRLRTLGYDSPRRLAALLRPHVVAPADLIDLGCGTGECGQQFAWLKGRATGIDLSERMLVQARMRGVYHDLHVAEIERWLRDAPAAAYDVAVAADVFIYIGALESVIDGVVRVLRRGGWFVFTTEECTEGDYALQPSGRMAHTEAYIRRIAGESFALVAAEPAVIRTESAGPIAGRHYVLRTRRHAASASMSSRSRTGGP